MSARENMSIDEAQEEALAEAREREKAKEPPAAKGATVTRLPGNHPARLTLDSAQTWWTEAQRAALAAAGLDNVPDGDLVAFLHLCQRSGLDPFAREIYLIGRKDRDAPSGKKWTAQTGIDGYRHLAERTGLKAGDLGPYWCGPDGEWKEVWLLEEPPVAARFGVLRTDRDEPFWGTALYREFVPMKDEWRNNAKTGNQIPSGLWGKMPAHMIAKCTPGKTRIQTDRGVLLMREIVNGRLPVKVRSVDLSTGEECWQPVIGWWRNAPTREWVRVRTPNGGRGNRAIRLTPDHPMWTPLGWKDAGDLTPADFIAVTSPTLTPEQVQVIQGGLLGDGHLAGRHRPSTIPHYAESHAAAQGDYLRWKAAALSNLGPTLTECVQTDGVGGSHPTLRMRTKAVAALYTFRQQKPVERLAALGDLGLAVWFMDDGQFTREGGSAIHCCGFPVEFADAAVEWLRSRYGIAAKVCRRARNPYIAIGVAGTPLLEQILAPWVRRSVIAGRAGAGTAKQWIGGQIPQGSTSGIAYVPVLDVERVTNKHAETRYDIEVEGTHTFVVNNVVVSNCAEALAHRRAFPREAAGIYLDEEMQQADAIAEAKELEDANRTRARQREELVRPAWGAGPPASPTETAQNGVIVGEVVSEPEAYDREALEYELSEQARVLDTTVVALARRWVLAHKKNLEDATDAELHDLVSSRREEVRQAVVAKMGLPDDVETPDVPDPVVEPSEPPVRSRRTRKDAAAPETAAQPPTEASSPEPCPGYEPWGTADDAPCINCMQPKHD